MDEIELQPVQNLKDTMLDATIDTIEDIAEIGLDSLLNEGVIKDIPIVGALFRIGKGVSSVKDAITAKRILIFTQQLRKNNIDGNKLQKHIEKLNDDPKKFNKELEIILDYIDKQAGYIKAKILVNFYPTQ